MTEENVVSGENSDLDALRDKITKELMGANSLSSGLSSGLSSSVNMVSGVEIRNIPAEKEVSIFVKTSNKISAIIKKCNTMWVNENGLVRRIKYSVSKQQLKSFSETNTIKITDVVRGKDMEIEVGNVLRISKYPEDFLLVDPDTVTDMFREHLKKDTTVNLHTGLFANSVSGAGVFGREHIELNTQLKSGERTKQKIEKILETLPEIAIAPVSDIEVLEAAAYKGKKIANLLKQETNRQREDIVENSVLDLDFRTFEVPHLISFNEASDILSDCGFDMDGILQEEIVSQCEAIKSKATKTPKRKKKTQ